MKDQIEVGLRELRASIKRMKELIEWEKLREQEGKGKRTPRSFRFQDRLEAHMKIEEGFFWKTVFEIQDVLGENDDATVKRHRQRMAKLEEEMRGLTKGRPR